MNSDRTLRLKRHYSIVAHSPDVVELRCGVWNPTSFTLTDDQSSGKLFELLSALDGSLTARELATKVRVSRSEVEALIDHLAELDLLEDGASSAFDYYLDAVAPVLGRKAATPPNRPVLLLGDPGITQEIERYLCGNDTGLDVRTVATDDPRWQVIVSSDTSWLSDGVGRQQKLERFSEWANHFLVFATTILNPVRLLVLNRISLEHGIPWFHACVDGPFLLVGPTFIPHRAACYECFETRVLMNLREGASYQRYKNALARGAVENGRLSLAQTLVGVLSSHTALEVLNFLRTGHSFTTGKVLAIHLPTMEFTFNDVLRLAACPGCGAVSERDDRELYFDMRALIHGR
jgi:thiazole/oxazole-forming peptide maturase SagC family component